MNIHGYLWLDDIVDKLATKHNVQMWEVEEVIENNPVIRFLQRGERQGENLYSASGQTDEGRYIIVYFIYKQDKRALPISARDMTKPERRQYERS